MNSNHLFTYDRLSDFVKNYKEYVERIETEESNPETENYKYYHFEQSPEGITMSNVGRFGRDVFSNNSSWKELPFSNGIDAWRMNLAKLYNDYKIEELNRIDSSRTAGLKYILNKTSEGKYVNPRILPNIDTSNLSHNATIQNADSKVGVIEDFSQFKKMFSELLLDVENHSNSQDAESQLISIDFTGLINVKQGNYKFTGSGENCNYFIWIGDQAICEYLSTNSTINKGNNSYNEYYPLECYVPIRIQCYFSNEDKDTIDINFSVVQENMVQNKISNTNVTKTSLFNCIDPPLLLYCAFVSESNNDFLNDNFKCFGIFTIRDNKIVVENYSQLTLFYKTFKENLNDVLNNKYDYNEDNRLSYGVIPNIKTEYTIINKEINLLPFCYSIYKINSDYRMGKTFQIKTKTDNNGTYTMNQFNDKLTDSILEYSNSYREKPGYYPNKDNLDIQYFTSAQDLSGVECKTLCNENPNCRYYFTYTSNEKPKCIINSDNSLPYYNRIPPSNSQHPVDENSSSVFLRNYQLDISGGLNCGTFSNINRDYEVKNTTNFSDTFKYSKYAIDKKQIVTPNKIGICGDVEYLTHQNDAKKILYDNALYYRDGSWREKEGFTTDSNEKDKNQKITHAISDTGDSIRKNLNSERGYSGKMVNIDEKYEKLQHKIPKYNQLKNEMIENPKYDFKGDELLHFRTHLQPDVRKKKIMDNNELYVNSQLLFALGTVTSATLIVFAILLARE